MKNNFQFLAVLHFLVCDWTRTPTLAMNLFPALSPGLSRASDLLLSCRPEYLNYLNCYMRTLLLFFFVLMTAVLHAQDTTGAKKDITFTTVQVEAQFPGGRDAWVNFLTTHIHPEVAAKHKAPPGRYTVTISFIVDETGKVSEVQVINDPGYGTADDVLKAFKHTPDWIPATQNGKQVTYRQRQNITYQVTEK